jgi:CheY-like chemotaxis protein
MFVADLLKDQGLQVVECASAEAAELVLASTGNELRALVTDINLACDMSGVELAQFAKCRFPDLNVVMVSGRGTPYVPHNTRFLMKPYLPGDLLAADHRVVFCRASSQIFEPFDSQHVLVGPFILKNLPTRSRASCSCSGVSGPSSRRSSSLGRSRPASSRSYLVRKAERPCGTKVPCRYYVGAANRRR